MEKKICSKCLVEKGVCEFYKNPKKENEVRNTCKICMNKNSKKYYQNNIELEKERHRKYSKEYYLNNKITENIRTKNYRNNNLEKVKEIQRLSKKKEREKNPEKFVNLTREWRKNNPEYNVIYNKNRRQIDPIFKLKMTIRGRIRSFLKIKNITKKNKTFDIVGCSPEFLKKHLEKQFTNGMCWENHGLYGWHIDHIIPVSTAKTDDGVYSLCHYTNLQPLWAEDNLKKSDKILF
jgi:hypothetical protein